MNTTAELWRLQPNMYKAPVMILTHAAIRRWMPKTCACTLEMALSEGASCLLCILLTRVQSVLAGPRRTAAAQKGQWVEALGTLQVQEGTLVAKAGVQGACMKHLNYYLLVVTCLVLDAVHKLPRSGQASERWCSRSNRSHCVQLAQLQTKALKL